MKFTVRTYQQKDKALWNAFITTAKNATFLFVRDFMDYHSDRFEDFSLLIFKDDKLFAVLPANKKADIVYTHQGLTYGSFVLQDSSTLLDAFEAFKAMLQFLHNEGINYIKIKLIPTFYNSLPSDELAYFLFKSKAKLINRDVLMVIDYQNQLPFKKNRREGINKAKRNGLTVTIDENYEGFWNEVLIPNLEKKHQVKPVHSVEEIKLLASRFPENIKQISVYKEGKIVAGTTLFLTKTTVHPQYVSGNAAKNSHGSLDLAYHFAINHFKEGRRYFDFNISSENEGSLLNEGLIFWKETCGARTFCADNYLLETTSFKNLNLQVK